MKDQTTTVTRGWAGWAIAGLLMVAGGCSSSPYISGYSYFPRPAVVEVHRQGARDEVPVTVLASIVGVRHEDPDQRLPAAVDVRLRFENNGPSHVVFDPNTLDLVNGALRGFPPPQLQPPMVIDLAPGQRQEVTAIFPFAPGLSPQQMNLNNLRLRWQIRIDNNPVPQNALFERVAGESGGAEYEYRSNTAY